ncbi:L-cystine-binding protein TcyA, partial [Bacillus inaquosorum]|nr:L-cystine-binding protein TcyA [Bacillus inaquosorum]
MKKALLALFMVVSIAVLAACGAGNDNQSKDN